MTKNAVTRVVFLSGYPRVGKDEIANHLRDQYGYNKIAFADGVREFLLSLDPMIPETGLNGNLIDPDTQRYYWISLSEAVEKYGWDKLKEDPITGVRRLMQRMGTEVGREMLGEHFWVFWAEKKPLKEVNGEYRVVVPDWRFPNEGGFSPGTGQRLRTYWFVDRPGFAPINDHKSESHYKKLREMSEHVINNEGTLEQTLAYVDRLIANDLSRSCRSIV